MLKWYVVVNYFFAGCLFSYRTAQPPIIRTRHEGIPQLCYSHLP